MLQANKDQIKKRYATTWKYGSGVATDQIRPSLRTDKLLEQFHGWELTLGHEILELWTQSMQATEGEAPAIRRAPLDRGAQPSKRTTFIPRDERWVSCHGRLQEAVWREPDI